MSFLHDESDKKIFSLSPVPGPVGNLTASSTLSKIYLSWHAPILPNGVIIAYEVSYRPADNSGHEISLNTTDLESSFTEGNELERGTGYIFSVRELDREQHPL